MKQYAFGVDIGGTAIKMGFFETDGKLLDTWEIPTRTEEGGAYILDDIVEAVEGKLLQKGIAKSEVEGIGMGVPGPVGADGTVYRCVNLGWGVFNIEKEMEAAIGLKIKAGNDGNVAALGEMWQGGGKGYKNMVMVTLGTGVGGGVLVEGRILAGANGAAGEIGHLPMVDDEIETECCGCGKRGCLEQYASATGIVRMAKKYLLSQPGESVLRHIENITAKDIFDAAREKDAEALCIVEDFGKMLGKGLAHIACVVNPEAFIIGGGMAKAGDILLETVQKNYRRYAFHMAREAEFKAAVLGNNAGIYGGVKLVLL